MICFAGDRPKIDTVVDAIHKSIADRGIEAGTELDAKQDQSLRRIHMFLVLNTNFIFQDQLLDDENCGHIIYCAPTLSKDLLVELIWRLSLHKYTCETIVCCPLTLGAELLDLILKKIGSMDLFHALPRVEELCIVVYRKYIRLQSIHERNVECAKSKLYRYFLTLLQYIENPDLREEVGFSPQALHRLAGFAVRCNLSLILSCLKLYLNPTEEKLDFSAVYYMSIPEFRDEVENEDEGITSKSFIDSLLLSYRTNFKAITVDRWLFWAEYKVDDVHDGRTLQHEISEVMYLCSEALKKVQNGEAEFELLKEVVGMLSSLAVKPRDEDNDIREADVELIINNVSDCSKPQRKWFKTLLALDKCMSDVRCIECLKKNCYLADCEDVKAMFEKIVVIVGSTSTDQFSNEVKCIGLDCLKQLSLREQIDTARWFFVTFGTSVSFLTDDFPVALTETFNKAVMINEKNEKVN
jgi:hypothetical protein